MQTTVGQCRANAVHATGARLRQLPRLKLHRLEGRSAASDDFVTSTFGKLFGQGSPADPEEMGLKRLSGSALSELYPATTDRWADLLPGDKGETALIRPMLADTSLEDKPLRLAFDADVDGWSATAFHKAVDTFGAGIVIGETVGGAIIGGYNPRGWIGLGEDRDCMAAFLFTWQDGNTSKPPVKLPKVGGASQAVIDKEGSGPQFGPDGLKIALSSASPRQVFSKLGSYYAKTPDGKKTLFADGEEVKKGRMTKGTELKWLRVYVAEGNAESWELNGIMWKTSQ